MFTKECYCRALSTLEASQVVVSGYLYQVDFGASVQPRFHLVDRQKRCTCGLGSSCPAVLAVIEYLAAGGLEPPAPPESFFALAPESCPVCGAPVRFDPRLCSRKRGAGWACSEGGTSHYWRFHFSVLAERVKANPWVFPPVNAPDGTLLYRGVLRKDFHSHPESAAG